ncbi:MAG TPA: hypothetical protein PKM88_00495 [bacterium]|nr:hypothetical protein [bacterium]
MLSADEQLTLALIRALKENEIAASRFYAACAAAYHAHQLHWQFLQMQEEEHTLVLEKIEKDFTERPHRWLRGKILPDTVHFLISELKKNTALVATRDMNEAHAINFSIDFESSLVEKELLASLSTSDPDFEHLLVKLRSETADHRHRLLVLQRDVRA